MSRKAKRLNTQQSSSIGYLILALFAAGFILSPYARGLFHSTNFSFEKNINIFLLFGSVFVFFSAVILIKRQSYNHWIHYAIWLIPFSFLISAIKPISNHSAMYSVLLYTIYSSIFIIGVFLFNKFSNYTIAILLVSGYSIALLGLLHWFGLSFYQDAVLSNRLSSVFQYANTNAIFILVLLFASLYLISCLIEKKTISYLISFMVVPLAFSFFVTESRGALLALPIILILVLVLLSRRNQIVFLIYTIIAFAIAIALYPILKPIGVALQQTQDISQSLLGWAILIAASVAFMIFHFLFQKFVNKLVSMNDNHIKRFILPGALLVIGIIGVILLVNQSSSNNNLSFLPEYLQNQISRINFQENSILERIAFFKDAFRMFLDRPIFGSGGGAWAEGFKSYQSNPYVSKETHNFYAQYLLETGIFGSLIFLIVIGYILFHFYRVKLTTTNTETMAMIPAIIVIGILVHSAIDFNMSFAYIASLVFLSLGGMFIYSADKTKNLSSNILKRYKLTVIIPVALVIVSITILTLSIRFIQSNQVYSKLHDELFSGVATIQSINEQLKIASQYQPSNPQYKIMHASLLSQAFLQYSEPNFLQEAYDIMNDLLIREPYNVDGYVQLVNIFSLAGDLEEVNKYSMEGIERFPWHVFFYEQSLLSARQLLLTDDNSAHDYYRNQINSVLDRIESQKAIQNAVPEGQKKGTPFEVSPEIIEMALSTMNSSH